MQIGPNPGAHTLQLFGIQKPGSSASPVGLQDAAVSVSFGKPKSPFTGIYTDPRVSLSAPAQSGGIPRATLNALNTYRDTDLSAAKEAFQSTIEKALGRKLEDSANIDQLTDQLSSQDRFNLPGTTRVDLRQAWAEEGHLRSINHAQERRGFAVLVGDSNRDQSTEQIVDYGIESRVTAAMNRLVHMKEVALSKSSNLTPDMKDALAASSGEEVEQIRASMIAAYKDDIASGAITVTRTEERVALSRTDLSESANSSALAEKSFAEILGLSDRNDAGAKSTSA